MSELKKKARSLAKRMYHIEMSPTSVELAYESMAVALEWAREIAREHPECGRLGCDCGHRAIDERLRAEAARLRAGE